MATRSKTTAKATEQETGNAAAEAEEAAKATCKVKVTALQAIRCDGKLYSAGKPVPVSEDEADQLVAAKVAER